MSNSIKCYFGLHQYEVIEQKDLIHPLGIVIGIVYISKCKHCSKIKKTKIITIGYANT